MTTSAFVISLTALGAGLAWLMRGFLGILGARLVALAGWVVLIGGVLVLLQEQDPALVTNVVIGTALIAAGRWARNELALRSIDRRYAPALLAIERHQKRHRGL